MAANIRLEVVTPERFVVKEEVQIVMAPGTLGEFGVLSGHTPFMSSLKLGVLRYRDTQNKLENVFISGGFAEVLPDKVTVLADSAEKRNAIDVARAKAAMERAQRRLEVARSEDIDVNRAKDALERALFRLRVAEKPIE